MRKPKGRHFTKEYIQIANKHMEVFSILLVIKEMKIETSVRYLFILTKMVKIEKPDSTQINKPAPIPSMELGVWNS